MTFLHRQLFLVLSLCCWFLTPVLGAEQQPPNVLLILTDDQGWGDVRSHENDAIDTPTMDRLAAEGVRFDRFFVSPVCAPTRASVLSGRYHLRTGVHGVTRARETMRSDEVTIAEILKAAGYATGCFGKWHNGANYPHHPLGQGFDEFFGFCAGHWNNYFDADLQHNGKPVKTKGYVTDVITDKAIEFMERNQQGPFLCFVPINTPHSPWQVADQYFDKYKARGLDDMTACAYAMCENIDDNLKRMLDKLDELQIENDTIVLFLTDNGPNSKRFNGGMRGRKASIYEGGVRVPLFIRWPGKIKPGTEVTQITDHIDLLPTLVELTGVDSIKTKPLDGLSLVPLIKGQTDDWPTRLLFTHYRGRGSVRSEKYRSDKKELHNMQTDPGQKINLAIQQPELQQKFQKAYEEWYADVTVAGFAPTPTEIGHDAWPTVTLPGHEAYLFPESKVPNGSREGLGISYNGRPGFANDWVTNWTDVDSYPQWEVKVVEGGKYRIALKYTCAEEDSGARVAVQIGDRQVEGTVTQAHNPDPLPRPNRIIKAHGAHMDKIWASLDLGSLELEPGRTTLRIRALTKPGRVVMDVKAVEVTKVPHAS